MVSFKQRLNNSSGLSDVEKTNTPILADIEVDEDLNIGALNFLAPQTNPFGLSNVGKNSTPTFANIDGDGDLDAFIGDESGDTLFFQNTGSPSIPQFAAPQTNPFGLSNVGGYSAPTFADIDADGDLDAFIIGELNNDGTNFFQNTGSASSPQFAPAVTNPFGLTGLGKNSAPTFADIDFDGDLDAFIGDQFGNTFFFPNIGSVFTPQFAAPQVNPFGLLGSVDVEGQGRPTFADTDGDGDLDAFIGDGYGDTLFFQNTGSSSSPQFAAPQTNPFGLSNVGDDSAPTFADIDGDAYLDAFIGNNGGNTLFFRNSPKFFATAQTNPFGLTGVGLSSIPTFADIESDGDLDAFVGDVNGNINYFQNTGSAFSPSFAANQVNPFDLSNVGQNSAPTFADIDGDGDLDAFIGDEYGDTSFFQNTGEAGSPQFATAQDNPFGLSNVGYNSTPTFADIDFDKDLDAFIGNRNGNTIYFQNTGSASSPQFAPAVTNPFGLSNVGFNGYSAPTFADIDIDGDLDALIGDLNGDTNYFRNIGSDVSPQFAPAVTNPFGLTGVEQNSALTFADITGDGFLDAFIGDGKGDIAYFRNTTGATEPLPGAGGQQQFTIAAGDGTVNISNFGGVGSGINPAAAVIAEVDTLQFTGPDLTPEKLLLTTLGDNLELSFEGVADTKVVLGNFALEDLDNLTQVTGAAVDLGNILFDGQSQIADSFDVFNADAVSQQVFNRNSVTFLNDLDNTIKGFNRSNDVINAQGGNDRINGRSGDDLLRGGDGRDKLTGGRGDDILVGGENDDLLNGGRGKDLFVLAADAGTDTVKDFQNGKDHLGLAGGLTFNQLTISQSNSNTLISLTNGGEVLASLTGVNANLIGVGDFTAV